MSKSKNRKNRDKQVKQGKLDPSMLRGSWGVISGVTKKTPTKQEKLNKQKYKRDYDPKDYNDA